MAVTRLQKRNQTPALRSPKKPKQRKTDFEKGLKSFLFLGQRFWLCFFNIHFFVPAPTSSFFSRNSKIISGLASPWGRIYFFWDSFSKGAGPDLERTIHSKTSWNNPISNSSQKNLKPVFHILLCLKHKILHDLNFLKSIAQFFCSHYVIYVLHLQVFGCPFYHELIKPVC